MASTGAISLFVTIFLNAVCCSDVKTHRYEITMMRAIVLCLVAFLFGYGEATVKEASAMCIWNKLTDNIEMTFVLDMNTEPKGHLQPIVYDDYNLVPKKFTRKIGCEHDFSNSIYEVVSKISYTDGLTSTENQCEAVELTDADGEHYAWYFLQTDDDDEFLDVNDRLYIIKCYMDELSPNLLTTDITVLTPNLAQTPSVLVPKVKLEILVENAAGSYVVATSGNAGDNARLRLGYERPVPYNGNIDPVGLYGFYTQAGPDGSFPPNVDTDMYIDKNGCPFTEGNGLGLSSYDRESGRPMANGYLGAPSSNSLFYYSTTGIFPLPKYYLPRASTAASAQSNSRVTYFRTHFKMFFTNDANDYADPCAFNTPNRKKRSSTEPEYERIITASIMINDDEPMENTSDASNDNMVALVIGAVSGTTLVMVIAGIICVVAILKRERRRPKRLEESRASSDISIVTDGKK